MIVASSVPIQFHEINDYLFLEMFWLWPCSLFIGPKESTAGPETPPHPQGTKSRHQQQRLLASPSQTLPSSAGECLQCRHHWPGTFCWEHLLYMISQHTAQLTFALDLLHGKAGMWVGWASQSWERSEGLAQQTRPLQKHSKPPDPLPRPCGCSLPAWAWLWMLPWVHLHHQHALENISKTRLQDLHHVYPSNGQNRAEQFPKQHSGSNQKEKPPSNRSYQSLGLIWTIKTFWNLLHFETQKHKISNFLPKFNFTYNGPKAAYHNPLHHK